MWLVISIFAVFVALMVWEYFSSQAKSVRSSRMG
jgi:hypothetical protein